MGPTVRARARACRRSFQSPRSICAAATTQVSLGGKQIAEAPLAEPLVLAPGTYTLSLAAVGYQPKDVELKVDAGSETERKIELDHVPVAVRPVEPDETPPVKKPDPLPLYIGAGAAGAFLIAGTITGIVAIHEHGIYTAKDSTADERTDARTAGRNLAHATDALLFIGALGSAAFTGYWYWFKFRPAHASYEKQAKVSVAPWVQGPGGGVLAVGSF